MGIPTRMAAATSRLAAAAITLAGPMVLLAAHSDRGPWLKGHEPLAFSLIAGFPLAFSVCSSLAIGVASPATSLARVLSCAIGAAAVFVLCALAAVPMMYGLAESRPCAGVAFSLLLAVVIAPAAAFQVWFLPVPGYRPWQFITLLLGAGSVAIASLSSGDVCSDVPLIPAKIWEAWPAILAALPAAGLVAIAARPVRPARAILLFLLAVLPFYVVKASYDGARYNVRTALTWPMRVWTDFIGWPERNALIQRVTARHDGAPVRIGEHWYRFTRVALWNPFTATVRRPDRVVAVQVAIPVEDIDLQEARLGKQASIELHITPVKNAPRGVPSVNDLTIATTDEDLAISIVAPRGREIDRQAVRDKIRRFIQASRVQPG